MKSFRAELARAMNRSTIWFVLLCVVLSVFAMSNARGQGHVPLWGFRQAGIFVSTLLMGRAATVAAGDFSSGTIRPWLISTASRGSSWGGKLAANLVYAVGVSIICSAVAYATSGAFGAVPSLSDAATAAGQLAAAGIALSLFGHAVGLLTRSIPVSLVITIGWILPVEHLLDGRFAHSDQWLPGLVSQQITLDKLASHSSATGAAIHAIVPFVILEVIAALYFLRRDISN